jgi:hypothetical protein
MKRATTSKPPRTTDVKTGALGCRLRAEGKPVAERA